MVTDQLHITYFKALVYDRMNGVISHHLPHPILIFFFFSLVNIYNMLQNLGTTKVLIPGSVWRI